MGKLDSLDLAALAMIVALAIGCGVGGWTTGRALVAMDAARCSTDSECAALPDCRADPTCDGGPTPAR